MRLPVPNIEDRQRQVRAHQPRVRVGAWQCYCGATKGFTGGDVWLFLDDQLEVVCSNGHRSILRFLPETIS